MITLTLIALIIFIGSFAGLAFLVLKKMAVLSNMPEEIVKNQVAKRFNRQDILQKTNFVKQAVLHNRGVEAVMAKATGKFKTVFANRIATPDDLQKVEQILQEGDYWQKVETHNAPTKKPRVRKKKVE